MIYRFFAFQLLVLLFMQKFGLPVGDQVAEAIFFTLWGGIGVMVLAGHLRLNVVRVAFYCGFAMFAIIAHISLGQPFSAPSLLQILFLYLPFCLEYRVSEDTYHRCMKLFINLMLVFAAIEFLQHIVQLTIGAKYWINFDKITPVQFIFKNFAYFRPMSWGSPYYKPNAEFFLEPSILAQFLGIATIIEVIMFRRYLIIAVLLLAQVLTFSGTGVLLLLVCAPFLMLRLPLKMAVIGLVLGAAFVAILFATGYSQMMLGRVFEFNQVGTSGYERFANPLVTIDDFVARQHSLFVGIGAGNLLETEKGQIFWASVKCMVEYGFAAFVAFHVYLLYSLFSGAPSKTLAFGLFFTYSFLGGAFAVPMYALACMMLSSLLRIRPPEEDEAAPEPLWRQLQGARFGIPPSAHGGLKA